MRVGYVLPVDGIKRAHCGIVFASAEMTFGVTAAAHASWERDTDSRERLDTATGYICAVRAHAVVAAVEQW